MTHDDLIDRAAIWLRNSAKIPNQYSRDGIIRPRNVHCRTVLTEVMGGMEIPDAIGWCFGYTSILIECKVSRSDFLADKKKPHRKRNMTVGDYRYFLAPRKLLNESDIPEDWGWLETTGKKVFVKKLAPQREKDEFRKTYELRMLWSELSLIQEAMEGKILYETRRGKRIMEFVNDK